MPACWATASCGGVGLEAHRGEEAGFQRIGSGLQQLGRELVAFPELVAVVLEHGLPAQRAENEAAARLAVIAVELWLAALQQAFGTQKIFVKRVARRVDEMQRAFLLWRSITNSTWGMALTGRRCGPRDRNRRGWSGPAGCAGALRLPLASTGRPAPES
jgi:hypothetical protein